MSTIEKFYIYNLNKHYQNLNDNHAFTKNFFFWHSTHKKLKTKHKPRRTPNGLLTQSSTHTTSQIRLTSQC